MLLLDFSQSLAQGGRSPFHFPMPLLPLPRLNIVRCQGTSILRQLHLEEIILRKHRDNWLLINQGSPPAIVVGMSGNIDKLVHRDIVIRDKILVIRRYTGGGTVVIDKETLFTTLITNSSDASCKPFPREIMAWTDQQIFRPVFEKAGLNDKFALRENDYVLNDMKVGGNAQTITKDRWVHHTSFLWAYDPEKMKYLKIPEKRPQYRRDRGHEAFLTTIKAHFGSVESFEMLLIEQLQLLFDVTEVDFSELERLASELVDSEESLDRIVRTKVEPF